MGHRLAVDEQHGWVMRVVADWGNDHDADVTVEGDPDQGLSQVERRGKHPWWLIGTRASGSTRFGAWLWLLFAVLAIVQLVTTEDHVVRWIAAGQVVIGLSLSASYFGSLRYSRRDERPQPHQH
jgi:hypothetical protein